MKKYKSFLVLLIIFLSALATFTNIAQSIGMYAALNIVEPTSVLILGDSNQNIDWMFGSNSFGGTKLAPGDQTTGILRIVNETPSRQRISSLGSNIQLYKNSDRINYDADNTNPTPEYSVGNDFMQWMSIEIDYLDPKKGILKSKLYDDTLHNFTLGTSWNHVLKQGEYVDLVYTLSFDKEADSSVAGIRAMSEFLVMIDTLGNTNTNEGTPTNTGGTPTNSTVFDNNNDIEEVIIEESDIPLGSAELTGHFGEREITYLMQLGLISGYPDGSIRPDWNTTRAEVAGLMTRVLELDIDNGGESPYSDALPMWAKPYIIATSQHEIFEGYPDGTFRANQTITRQEFATVLVKATQLKSSDGYNLPFSDVTEETWGINYIKALHENSIINGYPDGSFRPDNKITRAEMFVMIAHLIEANHLKGGSDFVNIP